MFRHWRQRARIESRAISPPSEALAFGSAIMTQKGYSRILCRRATLSGTGLFIEQIKSGVKMVYTLSRKSTKPLQLSFLCFQGTSPGYLSRRTCHMTNDATLFWWGPAGDLLVFALIWHWHVGAQNY